MVRFVGKPCRVDFSAICSLSPPLGGNCHLTSQVGERGWGGPVRTAVMGGNMRYWGCSFLLKVRGWNPPKNCRDPGGGGQLKNRSLSLGECRPGRGVVHAPQVRGPPQRAVRRRRLGRGGRRAQPGGARPQAVRGALVAGGRRAGCRARPSNHSVTCQGRPKDLGLSSWHSRSESPPGGSACTTAPRIMWEILWEIPRMYTFRWR